MVLVGTDFSGIDAPLQALAGVQVEYAFASESQKHLRDRLQAERVESDVANWDISKLPSVDLYVCGPPCQDYSTKGSRLGRNAARGRLFDFPLAYVRQKRPRVVLFENVKGLMQNKDVFDYIVAHLRTSGYVVHTKLINSQDFGMVQSRPRVYFVAIRDDLAHRPFQWPTSGNFRQTLEGIRAGSGKLVGGVEGRKSKLMPKVLAYLNEKALQKGFEDGELTVLDLGSSLSFASVPRRNGTPCLARKMSPSYAWVRLSKCGKPKTEFLRPGDLLELQGFPRDFNVAGMPRGQVARAMGNTMSVPVLRALFTQLEPFYDHGRSARKRVSRPLRRWSPC